VPVEIYNIPGVSPAAGRVEVRVELDRRSKCQATEAATAVGDFIRVLISTRNMKYPTIKELVVVAKRCASVKVSSMLTATA
jgi:hypothetical protein